QDMGGQILEQMFSAPRALAIAAGILILLGLIPGMPHVAFLGLGAMSAALAWFISQKDRQTVEEGAAWQPAGAGKTAAGREGSRGVESEQGQTLPGPGEIRELGWDDVATVDVVGLEVGYRLIPLVDKSQGGQLLSRIKGVRKKLSQDLGFLMPSVHIRDNLDLMPNVYRITLMGVTIAEAEIHPERELAIDPGQVFGKVEGIAGKDPAFGLDAIWIESDKKDQAQTLG